MKNNGGNSKNKKSIFYRLKIIIKGDNFEKNVGGKKTFKKKVFPAFDSFASLV